MPASRYCPSCLSALAPSTVPNVLRTGARGTPTRLPFHHVRTATQSANALKYRRKDQPAAQKRKKADTSFHIPDLRSAIQFPLIDAMRYLRAAEVGRSPTSVKYELHVRLRTPKNGAAMRNRLRLPHPVKTDLRICVICPPGSAPAKAALDAGATLVGEDEVFDAVKAGKIEFDRCICHIDSLPKLTKAGIARILGPRGLMPSVKRGTVVKDVGKSAGDMVGGSEYRERLGVVRMSIGQLGFTPEQLQRNIRAFLDNVKKDISALQERTSKEVHEVVLSSTNGPGFSLNGDIRGPDSVSSKDLAIS